ncbi:hypothetical protein FRC14_004154 [Serendipita sp. 396]|nr:hypothetical protein FRC14_004154 [Serendipita sp. 396]KAG8782489.1 hypothetical protein FRC15_006895 [Serendipita sp. 397]KAG8798503.1 hypothetical protein FRC16_007145 [Serendipita sp. 398]KAG8818607.1 hypothetical protein FRC19_010463 [Serendipita sp. 401]KAG8854159.1 hypothetical protein FRB91_003926 [Serendipita sp. 411]KAG8867360.1 hypothetical protein FRC20_005985 [Serendipita sp. 405]
MDASGDFEDLSYQIKDINYQRPAYIGPYSIVYRGCWKNKYVAVKVLQIVEGCNLRTMRRKIKRERTVWIMLDHPNILPLFGYAEKDERFQPLGAFISPWCQYGTAPAFLASHGNSLETMSRIELWNGVISGVQYLHQYDPCLVHGDLKPSNILIDENLNPRICDFGLVAIFLEADEAGLMTTSPHTGTERYLSPELVICDDAPQISMESDIYALGCIGLEFVFSLLPYHHRQNCRPGMIIRDILRGVEPAIRPPGLDSFMDLIWDIVERCLSREPSQRPLAEDVSFWMETVLSTADILLTV